MAVTLVTAMLNLFAAALWLLEAELTRNEQPTICLCTAKFNGDGRWPWPRVEAWATSGLR